MDDLPQFTADHHGYYRNGHPFFPMIQEHSFPFMDWSNSVFLRLPSCLSDDLNWSKEKEQARQIMASGKYIFWEIDLGLSSFVFTPENSAAFFSFSVAIEEFTAKIWPEFQKQTFGVVLYNGALTSSRNFPLGNWEPTFLDWVNELNWSTSEPHYDLYCIQILSEYLHRLVSFLPDSTLPFALIDAASIASPGKIAQLFSKERFEHIQLALKGATCPFSGICWDEGLNGQGYLGKTLSLKNSSFPSLGLYLPKDKFLDASLIEAFDKLILEFNESQTPFRIIPEEKLTEQWDGIDKLIVPSQAISGQGRRKLLGFIAAGGRIETFEGTEIKFS